MIRRTCPRSLVGVVVLALGVAGCGSSDSSSSTPTSPTTTPTTTPTPTTTTTTTTASLTGTVSNSSSEGINGATVTVLDGPEAGASVVTNSSGAYTFDSLTTGNVNFKATATFYRDSSAGVSIDGTNTLNFTLARSLVPLGGSVESSTGERLVGATVTILDGVNVGETADTNANGDYRFAELASGNVNFKATATGYADDRQGILVNGTDSLNFTLTLTPTLTITSVIVSGGPGTAIQDWEFTVTTNQTFASYNWDFGDGQTLTGGGTVQQHRYFRSQAGARTVSITAVRADESTQDATLDITIE